MKRLIFLAGAVCFFSCTNNQSTQKKQQQPAIPHAYYYYPKPNVYYDTNTKSFFYFDSSKKGWQSGNLPSGLQTDLGKSVMIEHPQQPVWTNNHDHRMAYSALLYADSSDFKKDSQKTTAKKDEVKKIDLPADEHKKKGLKKFLDKLFHRRRNH